MKNAYYRVLGIALGVALTAVSAQAIDPNCLDANATIFQETSGSWQNRDNWDPVGVPTSTKIACIPDGRTAYVVRVCDGGLNDGENCGDDSDCLPDGVCGTDKDVVARAIVVVDLRMP